MSILDAERLSDANKESVKELLSTFRTLFALDVAGISLLIPLKLRGDVKHLDPVLSASAVAFAAASALVMVYLFLLALRKIHAAEPSIIYQKPIIVSALGSVGLLSAAFVCFFLAIKT